MRKVSKDYRRMKADAKECECCGATKHLEVHHIIPHAFGGSDDEENLIILCAKCHALLTPNGTILKGVNNQRVIRSIPRLLQKAFYENSRRFDIWDSVETCDLFDELIDKLDAVLKSDHISQKSIEHALEL